MSENRPKKQLRISRACDFCHKRSIRCGTSSSNPHSCENCIDFGLSCTYNRPVKRGRGRQKPPHELVNRTSNAGVTAENEAVPQPQERQSQSESVTESPVSARPAPLDASWKAFASVSHPLIVYLIDVYFQVVYPIFPLFDRQSLIDRIDRRIYLADRDFFATVMSACSIAAGRIEDGSVPISTEGRSMQFEVKPSMLFAAAEETLPRDITKIASLDELRAYPLLALAAIQGRNIDVMHKYIGQYFTILSIRRWHDESNWPRQWTSVEQDEMRRVYWSTYTLDVYSSIVWNGCVHFQEAHSLVQYPSRADTSEYHSPDSFTPSWMVGWNFTTDLYRVLEHAVSRFRTQTSRFNILEMATPSSPTFCSGLNTRVNALYSDLPEIFKSIKEMSGNPAQDIYGFQAANIQATLALLRMMLFSVESGNDMDKKCSVAAELLEVFHHIPAPYVRAISAPLIYHLSGIGHILGSVINASLSETSYSKVRELLISMVTLLDSLESVLQKSAGASKSLLEQVGRIDQFMASVRQNRGARFTLVADGNADGWNNVPEQEISPQYQLPDDIVLDWTWPLDFGTENSFMFLQ